MKRLVLTTALAAVMAGPVAAGSSDFVYVAFGELKERIKTGDLDEASVCSVKRMVSEKFNLEMKKFELVKGGRKLNGDKTLGGDHVYNGTTLEIKPVSHSWQCT